MTTLTKNKTDKEELKELLIKNLPATLKAGNDKKFSNITEYKTIIALKSCKFINFNTSSRISFMVFDIDEFENQMALEYFKDINGFYEYICERIGFEPTYILQTTKGFHFAYHLKNHVFTHQTKALKYLKDVKKAISDILKCDKIASHKTNAIWRNPLLHTCYYSKQINYELSDFRDLIPEKKFINKQNKVKQTNYGYFKINADKFKVGVRNRNLFICGLLFANNKDNLTQAIIFEYLQSIRDKYSVDIDNHELKTIATSVFKYWVNDKIDLTLPTPKDCDRGVMGFEKMSNLSKEEYEEEKSKRQSLSAKRTILLRDSKKNKEQLLKDSRLHQIKLQEENQRKVLDAVVILQNRNEKITYSSLSKESGLDRRTVKKYYVT